MDLENLKFSVAPADAGQMIEVSYALDERGIYRRRHDRQDGSSVIEFAPWSAWSEEPNVDFWNRSPLPPDRGEFEAI